MDSHFDSLRRIRNYAGNARRGSGKTGELTLEALMKNFSDVTVMLQQNLLPLCLVWAGMFALTCWSKGKRERLILSSVFAFGAVAANYMLIVASYIPQRCLCTTTMLLILACAVLVPELLVEKSGRCLCLWLYGFGHCVPVSVGDGKL